MDTSSDSDNDCVIQELPTGQYEEDEVSDPEQDTCNQHRPGFQRGTELYRDNMWCAFLYGLDTYSRYGYTYF